MNERSYALSDRQLRRWLSGDVTSLEGVRPANIRVAEAEFGWPIGSAPGPMISGQPDHPSRRPSLKDREPLRTREFISWVAASLGTQLRGGVQGCLGRSRQVRFDIACRSARLATMSSPRSDRAQIAGDAVADYYGHSAAFYSARVGQTRCAPQRPRPIQDWVGLGFRLGGDAESCAPAGRGEGRRCA